MPTINFSDFTDVPTVDDFYEILDDSERAEYNDDLNDWTENSGEYESFVRYMDFQNKLIEDYLRNFDEEHNTNYAPTGWSRFSTKDSDGNALSEKQIEYFKNSKVRDENGNLLKVYHGTDSEFTIFDRSKSRANMDIQGNFFSPYEIEAYGYGENVSAYYLNITNPASESEGYKALKKFEGQNNAGIKAREYLESLGYDGVANYDEYIAFNPNQSKLVSNESPTDNDDIRFSTKDEPIDLSYDNELVESVKGKYGSEKYNIIRDYIFENIGNTEIKLSDGKIAIVDKRDAAHISHKSGNKKTASISKLKEIIETSKLVAYEDSKKDRKFTEFYYYESFVRISGETFPVFLNVGKSKNIKDYHIYDLTTKLRDSAHRINDVERPVGNALETESLGNHYNVNSRNSQAKFSTKSIPSDIEAYYNNKIAENRELIMILNNLGEDYKNLSGKVVLDDVQMRRMIIDTVNKYNSKISKLDFNNKLRIVYDYMANTPVNLWNGDEIIKYLVTISKEMLEESETVDDSLYDSEFRKWMRKTKIKVNDFEKIGADFGDYNSMRRLFFGKVILSKTDGIAIDELWNEMVEQSGGHNGIKYHYYRCVNTKKERPLPRHSRQVPGPS